ncbi:MAG TPA: DUF4139 domain-containing protein, partial [Gemmata sp.]|nr:DUF4139 domain-containing protein [Gemmata sp.]
MASKWLLVAPVAGAVGLGVTLGVGADTLLGAVDGVAKQDVKPAVTLPITRVVLFNSGVGYFSRSGEVMDDARVDLTFPEQDINDLLKSMVLEDFDNGRIAAVSYDSREPISRTLSSFAINLNSNPTFAGIVSQMRGERVDVVLTPGATNQPGKLSGVIVGVEPQKEAKGNTTVDVEVLNMWCSEGLRSVKLPEIQQLKFANPVIESEFRRALDVLALSHDSQKKSVQLHFAGEGKRKVQVGYVIEAPIWKTSYRLVLADKEKPYLQGWAMVENPTDEDWAGVKMALISGRPISFKMDLYNPLYVDRPTVEPELFASLRPVTYRGGFNARGDGVARGEGRQLEELEKMTKEREVTLRAGGSAQGGKGAAKARPESESLKRTFGDDGDGKFAKESAAEMGRRLATSSVGNAATAGALGDFFQYTIDHPVSLARQKSAMLPIV